MKKVNRIAIIELFEHSEVLRDMCFSLRELSHELWIFTSDNIYASLQPILLHMNLNWKLKQQNQSVETFFYEQEEQISACDLIFLLTTNIPFSNYSRLQFLNKSVVLIHNTHTFLQPHRHIAWSRLFVRDILLRIIRFYLRGEYLYLGRLMQKASVWAFPSKTVLNYAVSKKLFPTSQCTIHLPLGMFQDSRTVKVSSGTLRICIPGTIKPIGRDYRLVYRAFLQLLPKIEDIQIELLLLGRPKGEYGAEIQTLFKQLEKVFPNFHVLLYKETIEQTKYDLNLRKSDFLILPLVPLKCYDAFWEKLGYSSISGTINDISRFGIPAIIPAFYPLEDWRAVLSEKYTHEDHLLEVLKDWINNKSYSTRRDSYLSQQSELKQIVARFVRDLQKIMN